MLACWLAAAGLWACAWLGLYLWAIIGQKGQRVAIQVDGLQCLGMDLQGIKGCKICQAIVGSAQLLEPAEVMQAAEGCQEVLAYVQGLQSQQSLSKLLRLLKSCRPQRRCQRTDEHSDEAKTVT